jgi:hypothetical protein
VRAPWKGQPAPLREGSIKVMAAISFTGMSSGRGLQSLPLPAGLQSTGQGQGAPFG